MTDYFWDFAVAENAVAHPAIEDVSYLQNGFSTENAPAALVNLQLGDTVQFRVFDVTRTDEQASGFSLVGGTLTFRNAVQGQSARYPFNENASIPHPQGIAPSPGPGETPTTFHIEFTGSGTTSLLATSVSFSGTGNTRFPFWSIVSSPGLAIATPGRFLLTTELIVEDAQEHRRTFRVDPEMIVEGVG